MILVTFGIRSSVSKDLLATVFTKMPPPPLADATNSDYRSEYFTFTHSACQKHFKQYLGQNVFLLANYILLPALTLKSLDSSDEIYTYVDTEDTQQKKSANNWKR